MTTGTVELYHSPMSPCAQKVRIVLEEKEVGWTSRLLNLPDKENLKPEFLAINPKGLIPVLVHDGAVLTESTVIIEFLDDQYEPDGLRPAEPLERAGMRMWTRWVDEVLHPMAGVLAWPILVRPSLLRKSPADQAAFFSRIIDPARRRRQEELLAQGLAHPDSRDTLDVFRRTLERMDAALGRSPWLAGGTYSLADAALTPYVSMLWQFGMTEFVERYSGRVLPWFKRCRARPAFERAILRPVTDERRAEILGIGRAAWEEFKAA